MTPATVNLPTIWRGCDWGPVTFKWKDANGIPLNLHLSRWRPRAQSLNVILNAVITDDVNGVTTLNLTKDQTKILKLGVEKWDWIWEHLTLQGVSDYRFPPFLAGKVAIKDPVTSIFTDTFPEIPEELPPGTDPPEFIEEPPPTLPV